MTLSEPPVVAAGGGATAADSVLAVANQPFLWFCAAGVFLVLVAQTLIYMRAVRRSAADAGMTRADIATSFRAGAISATGPSMAVAVVAIALLATLGTPAVLMRIGLIGSAKYEVGAATLAAESAGGALGGEGYTPEVFAIVFAAISLGGALWLIGALVLTPMLHRGNSVLAKTNPAVLTVVPAAAMIAALFSIGLKQLNISSTHVFAYLGAATAMAACLLTSRLTGKRWVIEWSQGISIVAGLTVAYLITTAA